MNVDQMIYDTAISQGFTPTSAKLIIAQARFESDDYKSTNFKQRNSTSGMKFVGQPKAKKSEKPSPEGDYYAVYDSVQDAIDDKIIRLYNITRGGVTPQQLKDSKTPEDFAMLLKKRGYYGFGKYGTVEGNKEQNIYASGMKKKLLLINIKEIINNVTTTIVKNKNTTLLIVGVIFLATSFYLVKKHNINL